MKGRKRLAVCLITAMAMVFTLIPVTANAATTIKTPVVKANCSKPYKEGKATKKRVQFYWTSTKYAKYDVLMWSVGKSKEFKGAYTGVKYNTINKVWKCEKKPYKVKCKVRTVKGGKYSGDSNTKTVTIPAK